MRLAMPTWGLLLSLAVSGWACGQAAELRADSGPEGSRDSGALDSGSPIQVDAGAPVLFHRDIQPIFDRACNRCHQVFEPRLLAAVSIASLKTSSFYCQSNGARTPYVVPGHPELSHIIYKLTGSTAQPITDINPNWKDCENLMPTDVFKALPDGGQQRGLIATEPEAVELLRLWIAQGALDN